MFTKIALACLAISASLVAASPALSLKLTGPDTVTDIKNLNLLATVTNTGDEILKLLNDPLGPLSELPAHTFSINDASGRQPIFNGIKVKYSPSFAAKLQGKGVFTILAPGQSFNIRHDLSSTYNFTLLGPGNRYRFEARNLFHYVGKDEEPVEIYAQSEAHYLSLSGQLSQTRFSIKPNTSGLTTFIGCSPLRQIALIAAASVAQVYVAEALAYVDPISSATDRYTTWFGTYLDSRHSTIVRHFANMNDNNYTSYTFDCTCTDPVTFAYVYPNQFGSINICGAFWQSPLRGTDSQGGTLVHESSHFTQNAGTADHVYGQRNCKTAALTDPDEAIDNADSHEYFAENNPSEM